MKISLYQLEAHLKKIAPIYMVSGDEWVLKQDAISLIRKAAKQSNVTERVRVGLPEVQSDSLYTVLYSHSLLATKRLIELDFRQNPPNKIASQILHDYAKNPFMDQIVLIDMGKADAKITKTAWFAAIEKAGLLITIWPLERKDLPKWIRERAEKKYKLKMQQDAANLLADYTEGNLAAVLSALEKIYLLQPEEVIDRTLIETMMTDESRFTIFDLSENLIAFNKERSLQILQNLQHEGIEPTLILWGIMRELRLLALIGTEVKQGISYEELFQKHRIFSRRQPLFKRFLTTVSREKCWQFFIDAFEIDKAIKGVSAINIWNSLELFCLRITSS